MKRMLFVGLLMMGLVLSSATSVAAQEVETESTADVDAIAEVVLDVDPADLATALETAPTDADLPEGFVAPVDGVPENAEIVDAFSSGLGDLEGAIGNVSHGLDTDPEIVPGALSAGILTYITVEDEIAEGDLDDFEEGIESGLTDDPNFEGSTVERVQVQDKDAVLTTLVMEQAESFVVVQMLAMPVGNTMVVATVVMVDTSELDPAADVQPFTAELLVAGVNYLGSVAEGV